MLSWKPLYISSGKLMVLLRNQETSMDVIKIVIYIKIYLYKSINME